MIEIVRECTPEETARQVRYLELTPVRGISALLKTGQCKLSIGIERCIGDLGALRTEFSTLGLLQSRDLTGEDKFRLRDIVPLLRTNPGNEDCDKMLAKVQQWIEKDARGEIDYNSTVIFEAGEPVLKDGNHRTLAFFERRKHVEEMIVFPVFVARPIC